MRLGSPEARIQAQTARRHLPLTTHCTALPGRVPRPPLTMRASVSSSQMRLRWQPFSRITMRRKQDF